MSSLILDSGNFKEAYIDGKKAHKMFFRGDKIYDSTKWYAYGNKWTGTDPSVLWGGSQYLYKKGNSVSKYGRLMIGNTNTSGYKKSKLFLTDENKSYFKEIVSGPTANSNVKIKDALNAIGLESLMQCKSVYYVMRFKQTTYDGDVFVKPFIVLYPYNKGDISLDSVIGSSVFGIGTEYADETDNGFCFTYEAEYKGKTEEKVVKLTEDQMEIIDSGSIGGFLATTPWFLCKAFKTNDDTTSTKETAYFGGYLLLEVV